MHAMEKPIEINGANYVIRKMSTRGYLALMDLLGRRRGALAGVLAAARSGRPSDAERALGPVLADVLAILLAHCVRPAVQPDALAPAQARRLIAAARHLNHPAEIVGEIGLFFEAAAPLARAAAEALSPWNPADGSG